MLSKILEVTETNLNIWYSCRSAEHADTKSDWLHINKQEVEIQYLEMQNLFRS